MPNTMKMKLRNIATFHRAGMLLIKVVINCLISGMALIDFKGLRTLKVLRGRIEMVELTPGMREKLSSRIEVHTITKSMIFHPSFRYAFLPHTNPIAAIRMPASIMKMIEKASPNLPRTQFFLVLSSLSVKSYNARHIELRIMHTIIKLSKWGLVITYTSFLRQPFLLPKQNKDL